MGKGEAGTGLLILVVCVLAVGAGGCGRIGMDEREPLSPCQAVLEIDPDASSGEYEIKIEGIGRRVYCDMDTGSGGWTRIETNFDVASCPEPWLSVEGVAACFPGNGGCQQPNSRSVTFEVVGAYREIRGRIRGLQHFSTDGFNVATGSDLDSVYVEGISITTVHPRTHIWTYVSTLNRDFGRASCPCTGGLEPPSFVGRNYFCDTGNEGEWEPVWYVEDPLWDANGTDGDCNLLGAEPWFYQSFEAPRFEDIEVRIMFDDCDENIGITELELFVR